MDQRFLDETVSLRPELFKAMADFNRTLCKARSDSSSLLGDAWGSSLLRDPLIRRFQLESVPDRASAGWWDFSDETYRLLLVEDVVLHQAALHFSAAVYAEELASVIDRAQVLELRRFLGDRIFNYALRRGRYQIGSLRTALTQLNRNGSLCERIASLEAFLLSSVAEGWPERLRTLWSEKLRRIVMLDGASLLQGQSSDLSPLPPLGRDQRRTLWFTLKKLLLREAAPQWAPCFD